MLFSGVGFGNAAFNCRKIKRFLGLAEYILAYIDLYWYICLIIKVKYKHKNIN